MTEEVLFSRRFIDDVRRCAAGSAPAAVAEIERRIAIALTAAPERRERAWAHLVAAVNELLAGVPEHALGPAARLRTFARENADLGRPRDLAITDFRFSTQADGVLTARDGRRYLMFAPIVPATPAPVLDEVVPAGTRRLAECAVYAVCGGAATAALWFAFIVPV